MLVILSITTREYIMSIYKSKIMNCILLSTMFRVTTLSEEENNASIAVFIPSNQSTIADIIVKFTSHKRGITETVNMIHEKLPTYATAFSLHLNKKHSAFSNAEVIEIEWLGSRINTNETKKAFPQEN